MGRIGDVSNFALQFQGFMATIKFQTNKIEVEQTQKLKELSTSSGAINANSTDFLSFGGLPGARENSPSANVDFEKLVFGKESETGGGGEGLGDWGWNSQSAATTVTLTKPTVQIQTKKLEAPKFEWSTPSPTAISNSHNLGSIGGAAMAMGVPAMNATLPSNMSGVSSLSSFSTLQPTSSSANTSMSIRMMQPNNTSMSMGMIQPLQPNSSSGAASMGMDMMQPLQPNKTNTSTSSFGGAGFGSMTALRPQSSSALTYTAPQAQSSSGIDWSSATKKPGFPSNGGNTSSPSIWGTTSNQQRPSSTGTQGSLFSSFNPPSSTQNTADSHPTILYGQTRMQAPPSSGSGLNAFRLPPPPSSGMGMGGGFGQQQQQQQKKTGLDAWESLI